MFRRGISRLFTVGRSAVASETSNTRKLVTIPQDTWRKRFHSQTGFLPPTTALLGFSLMRLFSKDDETAEDKLITTIKRAILSIQRDEYEKAERILHLALRMAQDMQSKDGITYVYDTMANLAMDRGQFEKAEKLFVDVMQRLFGEGATEDDLRLIHISAKIAHMAEQSGQLEKAKDGFEYVLKKLEERMKTTADDPHVKELWGMTKNWYAQALMQLNAMTDARVAFEDAKKTYMEIHGKLTEEGLMMLNNLGVVCTHVSCPQIVVALIGMVAFMIVVIYCNCYFVIFYFKYSLENM